MAEYSVFIGNPNTERQNKVFLDMLNDLMTKVGVSDPLSLLFVSQPKINAAAKKMLDEVSRRRYGSIFIRSRRIRIRKIHAKLVK